MKYLTVRNNNNWLDDFDSFFAPMMRSDYLSDRMMKTDISDKGDHYLLEIDMPGVKKDEIKLELENGYLTVSTQRKECEDKQEKGYIRKERRYGSYSRSYYIGEVEESDISATYTDGTLTLKVNKQQEKLPKSTQIKID